MNTESNIRICEDAHRNKLTMLKCAVNGVSAILRDSDDWIGKKPRYDVAYGLELIIAEYEKVCEEYIYALETKHEQKQENPV